MHNADITPLATKIARQWIWSTSTAAKIIPSPPATEPVAVSMPIPKGTLEAGNSARTVPMHSGRMDAATPCMARPAMISHRSWAVALMADPTAMNPSTTISIWVRPRRSPSRLEIRVKPAPASR